MKYFGITKMQLDAKSLNPKSQSGLESDNTEETVGSAAIKSLDTKHFEIGIRPKLPVIKPDKNDIHFRGLC